MYLNLYQKIDESDEFYKSDIRNLTVIWSIW